MPDREPSLQQAYEIFVDFKTKTLIEVTNIVSKGATLYLAMLGLFAGYVVTQDISNEIKQLLLIISLTMSIIVIAVIAIISWGVYRGINNIENTLKSFHSEGFARAGMSDYFRDGRIVFWAIVATGFAALLILLLVISIFMDGRLIALA